jgi:hypothetical protein
MQFLVKPKRILKIYFSQLQMSCETPVTGLSTPPSHEKMGEQARRRLFFSPGMKAAMQPFVKQLSFNDSEIEASGFATSTPAAPNNTITISSSPWRPPSTSLTLAEINALLPPMEGPKAEEIYCERSLNVGNHFLADLCRPSTPLSPFHPKQDTSPPTPLPPRVQHLLGQNLTRPVTVVVTKYTTYEIIPH